MRSFLFAALLAAAACSSETAFADQVAAPQAPGPRTALAIAPDKIRAPYDVQVVRENGETLPTYASRGRFYVQGNANERYIIRVTNPTPNRVEAVVSVDGLDVVDGEDGDLRKRGYIVPAYGDVRIEGFRTSLADVATFRFSSVDGSYAGKKGKARNVGVIAVAIFEETAPPPEQQIIIGDARPVPPPPPAPRGRYNYEDDLDATASAGPAPRSATHSSAGRGTVAKADKAPARKEAPAATAPAPSARPMPVPTGGFGGGGAGDMGRARPPADEAYSGEMMPPPPVEQQQPRTGRLGLGTEFGEQRNSSATYTRFVRSPGRPIAVAELRYNDTAGLTALGIIVQPLPDEGEMMTRETADPFPGDAHFSRHP